MRKMIEEHWDEILDILNKDHGLSIPVINAWIKPLKIYKIENDTVTFVVDKDTRAINFLKDKYYDFELKMAIQEYTSCDNFEVEFVLKNDIENNQDVVITNTKSIKNEYEQYLNPKYTFETFVIGDNNRFAQATSIAVAESPATTYNPLFLYGGAGLGKTHLMQSIAHQVIASNPKTKALYVTSEDFTNDLISSLKTNNMDNFRKKYRDLDMILIDDIQFVIGKESTQEEFFNTFNTLYQSNKQIVISSDRPPKEFSTLPERLQSRFEWGVTADIGTPNYETKMAILSKRAESDHLEVNDEVMQYIANNIKSNIRELEGALNKICVYSKLKNNNKPIDIEMAQEALKDLVDSESKEITPELIIQVICEHFNISKESFLSSGRSQNIVKPRQIAMYLCRKLLPNMTVETIGKNLGGRHHTTVLHGINLIIEEMKENQSLSSTIDTIIKKINSN